LEYKEGDMLNYLISFVLLIGLCGYNYSTPSMMSQFTKSNCPTISVECPDEVFNKAALEFRANLQKSDISEQNLTYKWTVSGGDLISGQGTSCITITNFDITKKALIVSVEVTGLPEGCENKASCTIVV
jgi:hypothetical protein